MLVSGNRANCGEPKTGSDEQVGSQSETAETKVRKAGKRAAAGTGTASWGWASASMPLALVCTDHVSSALALLHTGVRVQIESLALTPAREGRFPQNTPDLKYVEGNGVAASRKKSEGKGDREPKVFIPVGQ